MFSREEDLRVIIKYLAGRYLKLASLKFELTVRIISPLFPDSEIPALY